MANSFFQSLSPDIAAAVVKIDANKTVIDENKVILVDVHNTDLPAAVTKIDANKTVVDAIRATDIPDIQTNINANETKIDVNENFLWALISSLVFPVSASDNLLFSADTERSNVGTTWTKVKEIRIDYPGTYRFTVNTKIEGPNAGEVKIYKNGATFGTAFAFTNTSYPNIETEDLVFATADLLQLYIKNGGAAETTYIKEFRIKGDVDTVLDPVIID